MTDPREELERLVMSMLEQHDSLATYFRLAEQSGFSLVVALDAIDWNGHWFAEDPTAALFMHERVPPMEATAIARALHDAGHGDDEVLRALLENGLSSARALRLLGEHGWSVDRMVVPGTVTSSASLLE